MHSSLKPKQTDDPHDFLVVPPDAVRVAPSDDEISDLLRAAARQHSDSQGRHEPDLTADSSVPPVDATFRPTAVNDDLIPARGRSTGRRAMRAIVALLIAASIGGAAMAWQASGYAAKKLVAKWIPQFALTTSLTLDNLGLGAESAPPASEPEVADAAAAQSTPPAQSAPEGAAANAAAPSPDSAQLLQSMARDLANVGQEVEALKAGIAELKASQQQMARELAKASEQNARAKLASVPPRPAVATARKPTALYSPTYSPAPTASAPAVRPTPSHPTTQAASAPPAPLAQPYAPRQAEPLPQPAPQLRPEPGLTSVPRPPMPVQ